jgi:hypothetical protein
VIPETSDNILETNTTRKSFKLTFQANQHLFDAFSKNLYANTHESVVREVISNALDAQVRAGNSDKPLTIILNNEFIVQDNGTGISPEKMENTVGVYGVSDKRETNDEIGMFGFGFKSPFAVSDQFVVETVPGDGYKYVWVIHKDLTGSGEISLTSQVETDEPVGTKVRIPIKSGEYNYMQRAVLKYINFLKPFPITHFQNNYMASQPTIILESDDYVETNNKNLPTAKLLYDGWMPYDVSIPQVNIPNNVFIKIEKGKLRLSASRENVTVTNDLKNLVTEKLKKYWDHLYKDFETRIMNSEDPMKIINIANEIIKKHQSYFNKPLTIDFKKHPVYGDFKWPDSFKCIRHYNKDGYYKSRIVEMERGDIKIHDGMQIIYAEEANIDKVGSRYYKIKFKHLMNTMHKTDLVLVSDSHLQQECSLLIKKILENRIDIVKYKVPREKSTTPRQKYEKGTISAFILNDKNVFEKGRVKLASGNNVYGTQNYELNAIPKQNGFNYCLVTKHGLKKVKELENWFSPKEYIKYASSKFTEDDASIVMQRRILGNTSYLLKHLFERNLVDIDNLNADDIKKKYTESDLRIIELAADYGLIKYNKQLDSSIALKSIHKKYPLLEYLHDYKVVNSDKAKKLIEEYIQLIQEKNKCQTSA